MVKNQVQALLVLAVLAACSSSGAPEANPLADAGGDKPAADSGFGDGAVSAQDGGKDGGGAPGLGFSPWLVLDAEGGTLGQKYQWSDADGDTRVDATHVFEGSRSFKMHATKPTSPGGGQFGTWGGIASLPTPLKRGDTLHTQFSIYLPNDFDWAADPWLKFVRIHTQTSTGDNAGYNDLYIYDDGSVHNIYESGKGPLYWAGVTGPMRKGIWETFELAVTFDDKSVDSGGKGRTRVWRKEGKEMVLAMDRTDSNTLSTPTDTVDRFHFFTYWNRGGSETGTYPTKDQDCWVDRVVFEKDITKLVERDAKGNPIIGGL
jgi:hypothetical protein